MPMYTVKPGDYLVKIANEHGIANWKTIWDHPNNAELRKKRKSPDVLFPGDQVFVPVVTGKHVSLATGAQHTLTISAGKPRLRLRILDVNGDPVANQMCFIDVDTATLRETDADGRVEVPLEPDHPVEGELVFPDLGVKYRLMIGGLDPENTPSGEKHRLNNLAYYAGSHEQDQDGEADDWQLRWAQEEFEKDHGVDKPKFQTFDPSRLRAEHGC